MNSSDGSAGRIRRAAGIALLVAAAMTPGGAGAQQAAGRVLVVVGTVSVERGSERIPAATGTEVRKGDTIQVGPQSNTQIRFADESIVALRPDTTFRITEFTFRGQNQEKDSGIFGLLKGGLRTVTGLLGKENYSVETPTATIGIRGTHYTLRVCENDCVETTTTAQAPGAQERIHLAAGPSPVNDAGPLAQLAQSGTPVPNGTYGSVTDGRISVTNQSGVREFGADQYFHVASRTAPPQQLIGPPSFLRDRLEGRGRGNQQRTATQSSSSSSSGTQQGSSSQSSGSGTSGGSSSSGSSSSSSSTSSSGSSSSSTSGSDQGGAAASTPTTTSSSGGETATTLAPTGQGGGSGDSRVSSSVATTTAPVTVTPTLTQVTNQVSTSGAATVLQTTASSTNNVYRLSGTGLNIPFTTCSSPPCSALTAVDLIVQVNPTSQTARIVLALRDASGNQANINNTYGDFPVTISGSQLVVNASANSADFPNSAGSFRCSTCGPGNTVGVFVTTDYSIVINGNQATLTVTATDASGTSSFTATLPQVSSAVTTTGAIAGRNIGVNGAAGSYIQMNSAGQPVFIGEPLQIGNNLTAINTATNQTIGGNASAGNLVWGTWTGSAIGVNGNFQPYTQIATAISPWIVGDQTNVLPPSLGVVSFTPVGSIVGNSVTTAGTLNSASMTADFVNRNVNLSINATSGPGGGTYQMNGSGGFSAINGRFGAAWTSISCTGSCGTGPQVGSFTGAFTGANALGAGVAFFAQNTGAGVFGVVGFKR